MSEVKRYRCYGKDDFGHPYDALSMTDDFGDWVRAEDCAALEERCAGQSMQIETLRAALRQCWTKMGISKNRQDKLLGAFDECLAPTATEVET